MIFKRLARSELLSTFFPTWIWQGRIWSTWRIPKYDPYYWINAHVHPVISTYYPPSILVSLFAKLERLDASFGMFIYSIVTHVIFCFIGWYFLCLTWTEPLCSIFGAITFTLAGYNWKQQPCFQYTVAWFPWMLYGVATDNQWLAGIALGMTFLAGYYPIGLQTIAIAIGAAICWRAHLWFVPIGVLIGLVQLVPFVKYLPKTIRANKHDDIGTVHWWNFIHLIFPKSTRWNINGVGYWEMSYYVGIIPLLTIWYTTSRAWLLVALSLTLMLGLFATHLPRIPARWSYTFQFGLIWCAVSGLSNLHLSTVQLAILCGIQLFDLLWHNSPLLITRPYSELWNRPSHAFNTRLTRYLVAKNGLKTTKSRVSGLPYPLFTGHINEIMTLGYSGGMQLKLMAKWRRDECSNGSGQHDFFKGEGNANDLDRYRVIYARTTAKTDWIDTGIKHLYLNPAFKTS